MSKPFVVILTALAVPALIFLNPVKGQYIDIDSVERGACISSEPRCKVKAGNSTSGICFLVLSAKDGGCVCLSGLGGVDGSVGGGQEIGILSVCVYKRIEGKTDGEIYKICHGKKDPTSAPGSSSTASSTMRAKDVIPKLERLLNFNPY